MREILQLDPEYRLDEGYTEQGTVRSVPLGAKLAPEAQQMQTKQDRRAYTDDAVLNCCAQVKRDYPTAHVSRIVARELMLHLMLLPGHELCFSNSTPHRSCSRSLRCSADAILFLL